MKLITTTGHLESVFGLKKAVEIIAEAGFDALDFSAHTDERHYNGVYDKEFYTEIKKHAEDLGLSFRQAHAPFASSFPDDDLRNEHRFNEIVTSIRNASYLGVERIIVHPCQHLDYNTAGNPEILFEYNMDFYKRLIPYCEEYNIKIATENMWQCNCTQITHSVCSRPAEFIKYLDTINNYSIVGCLDIGHAMLVSEQPDAFIRALGNKRLACIHLHDVNINSDSHTLPYFGIIDWDRVFKALADIDYKGNLTYEADGFFKGKPIELNPAISRFMAETGRFLIDKFERYSQNKG